MGPLLLAEVPDGAQTYTLKLLMIQKASAQIRKSREVKASRSHKVWTNILSCAAHLQHSGLSNSPIR